MELVGLSGWLEGGGIKTKGPSEFSGDSVDVGVEITKVRNIGEERTFLS